MARDGQGWAETVAGRSHLDQLPPSAPPTTTSPTSSIFCQIIAASHLSENDQIITAPSLCAAKFRHRNQLAWLGETTGGRWFGQIRHWLVFPFLIIDSYCLPSCFTFQSPFFSPEIWRIVNIFERLQAFIAGQAGILRAGSIVFSQGAIWHFLTPATMSTT